MARSMLKTKKFGTEFWAKAIHTAVYTLNRCLVITNFDRHLWPHIFPITLSNILFWLAHDATWLVYFTDTLKYMLLSFMHICDDVVIDDGLYGYLDYLLSYFRFICSILVMWLMHFWIRLWFSYTYCECVTVISLSLLWYQVQWASSQTYNEILPSCNLCQLVPLAFISTSLAFVFIHTLFDFMRLLDSVRQFDVHVIQC